MADGDVYLDAIRAQLDDGHRQWRRGDKLLAAFGYVRRRQSAIDLINEALDARGLETVPALSAEMPLDKAILFRLKGAPNGGGGADELFDPGVITEVVPRATDDYIDTIVPETVTIPAEPPSVDVQHPAGLGLTVKNLASADHEVQTVNPSDTVVAALTTMSLKGYSQLAVASSPHNVRGVISYRSIAQAWLHGDPKIVADCLDATAPQASPDTPLLDVVALLKRHDVVLVVGADKKIAGLVTRADIAEEFEQSAAPFLLIGEIEDQLRWLVQKRLDVPTALAWLHGSAPGEPKLKVEDLTMGELQWILQNPEYWQRIGIKYDQGRFCKDLDAIREIRNAIMHFRDEGLSRLDDLKNFAAAVQQAYLAIGK